MEIKGIKEDFLFNFQRWSKPEIENNANPTCKNTFLATCKLSRPNLSKQNQFHNKDLNYTRENL